MERRHLLGGTVTFLFSDIEGSTRLLDELGPERYAEILGQHRRVMRAAFDRHGGLEVDTQGDASFAVFRTADGAVAAAHEIQDELSEGRIKVRIGVHTGTPHVGKEGYIGPDVHRGARIAAAVHGGQVVLSAETRDALTLGDIEIVELGEHRLKDFPAPASLFQIGTTSFPPLRTISNTNLPRPASAFLGRTREVNEIVQLLRGGTRFLTLTGPGGTGKTRLAIESAAELVGDFKAGVFWVALASLRDPSLVVETIGAAIGAKDALPSYIGSREMLLALDNLEQVIDCAPGLATLVEACPNLRVIATSRERLRVRGEREYGVPPLNDGDAVRLFLERAQIPADDVVGELCHRLDNLPLAIELAAARVNILTPAQILERLGNPLDLFRGGRDADARQQTLRATIAWSYDLLTEQEQRDFGRLAVFRGGWSLEAAEEITDADLDVHASLVDKSLLRKREDRFVMLETIREFAREWLESWGEAAAIRQKHADYFLRLAEDAHPHLNGADSSPWFDRLDADNDNLRAALDYLEARSEFDLGLRMAGALGRFWATRSMSEGKRRLEHLLELADPAPSATRLNALFAVAALVANSGDFVKGRVLMEQSIEMAEMIGDRFTAARSRMNLGAIMAAAGEWETARDVYSRSISELDGLDDLFFALWARRMLAWMSFELGDVGQARALYEEVLHRAAEAGDEWMQAIALGGLGEYAIAAGRMTEGLGILRRSIDLFERLGDRWYLAADMMRLGQALAITGVPALAAQMLGAADRECEQIGAKSWVGIIEFARTVALVRGALDDSAWHAEFEQGRSLSAKDAISRAFEGLETAAQS